MASYIRTMQARSKPRLRHHSDGKWYCYRNHVTAFGVYLGRTTGAGDTPKAAFDDLALLEAKILQNECTAARSPRA